MLRVTEDIGYPGIGAALGGMAGAELGPPGIAAGAAFGGAAGDAAKFVIRDLQGRTNEDSPQDRALSIATSGIAGPLQEAKAIRGATKLGKAEAMLGPEMTSSQKLGAEFNVPLSRAQQTQGFLRSGFESIIRRSFGAEGIFRKNLDLPANESLIKAAQGIADDISKTRGTPAELGMFVKGAIGAADKAASDVYGEALQKISSAGADQLAVNVRRGSPLQTTAQKLVEEIRLNPDFEKGLAGAEGRQKALNILESFADPMKEVQLPNGQVAKVTKSLTWEEARRLRTQLFEIADSPEINIGQGKLKQLAHALNDAMGQALKDGGRSDLAAQFDAASRNYKSVNTLLEHSTIQRLIKNDKPELVADVLLAKGSETNAGVLRTLIDPQKMRQVEGALWEKMFTDVLNKNEGVMVRGKLENSFDALGPEAQKAIWSNPDQLAKVRRFVKLVDTVSLSPNLTKPASSQGNSLLAFGQFAGALNYASEAGRAILSPDPSGFVVATGKGAAVLLTPSLIARVLTRPGAIDVMSNALKTKPGTEAGSKIAVQLVRMALAEQARSNIDRYTRDKMNAKPTQGSFIQQAQE